MINLCKMFCIRMYLLNSVLLEILEFWTLSLTLTDFAWNMSRFCRSLPIDNQITCFTKVVAFVNASSPYSLYFKAQPRWCEFVSLLWEYDCLDFFFTSFLLLCSLHFFVSFLFFPWVPSLSFLSLSFTFFCLPSLRCFLVFSIILCFGIELN